jgi:hypothetical protein
MDPKLSSMSRGSAERPRQQISPATVKPRSGNNSTGRDIATSSPQTGSSHRTQHPPASLQAVELVPRLPTTHMLRLEPRLEILRYF